MKVQSINPATEEVNKEFETMTSKEALAACRSARKAFEGWRDVDLDARLAHVKRQGEVLREKKGEYARLATAEMGRLLKDAEVEVGKCADLCDYLVANAPAWLQDEPVKTEFSKSVITFEPKGVVLIIMPWNYPFSQVARCAISLKPDHM